MKFAFYNQDKSGSLTRSVVDTPWTWSEWTDYYNIDETGSYTTPLIGWPETEMTFFPLRNFGICLISD